MSSGKMFPKGGSAYEEEKACARQLSDTNTWLRLRKLESLFESEIYMS